MDFDHDGGTAAWKVPNKPYRYDISVAPPCNAGPGTIGTAGYAVGNVRLHDGGAISVATHAGRAITVRDSALQPDNLPPTRGKASISAPGVAGDRTCTIMARTVNEDDATIGPVAALKLRPLDTDQGAVTGFRACRLHSVADLSDLLSICSPCAGRLHGGWPGARTPRDRETFRRDRRRQRGAVWLWQGGRPVLEPGTSPAGRVPGWVAAVEPDAPAQCPDVPVRSVGGRLRGARHAEDHRASRRCEAPGPGVQAWWLYRAQGHITGIATVRRGFGCCRVAVSHHFATMVRRMPPS